MIPRLFALSLGIAGFVLVADRALPSATGTSCADRATVIADLAARQGDSRRTLALASPRLAVELYTARRSRKWSLVVSADDGTSCLIGTVPALAIPGRRA